MTPRPLVPRALSVPAAIAVLLVACEAFGSPTPRPACPTSAPRGAEQAQALEGADRAVVTTNTGSFTIELYPEAAPLATANFVALARCGFYDQLTFHRVVAGFVIQAGDPQTREKRELFAGVGTGGPGYRFEIEIPPADHDYDRYVVAMANAAPAIPDSNGSQFFIALDDLDLRLPRDYTIFGKVGDGTEVVDAIGQVPAGPPPENVPLDPIVIESIQIEASGA
jgi:cyclophilin family peptidyl-prolyl cis-trans isomerase